MDTVYYAVAGTQGGRGADMIWTSSTQQGRYTKQAQAIHRLTGDLNGVDLGVSGVPLFRGIPIMWHPSWPSGRMDWLTATVIHPRILKGCNWEQETPGKPNNVAIEYELRKYFTANLLVSRPEANAVHVISGA
jgi:hypothetical protein